MRGEWLRRPLYPLAALGLVLFLLTAHLYLQGWTENVDANTCKAVYMYPSYARIKSFDETHTKYASKYSLYLYREQGLDKVPASVGQGFDSLYGVPVLFIPGNAGSYRQVRSIASECSNLYFDEDIRVVDNARARNLDFFAADFNEDFTAFHGRTLLDQVEYLNEAVRFILLLYALADNAPKSVMILAHSMGGIVARAMLTMPAYLPGSINTIVTLASPHSAAPLTFDGDILKIYSTTDRYWHDAFHEPALPAYSKLDDVCVVSITGGLADAILPADYTTLGFLVPPSNGLTVYTTGIPGVWTPMDHLAIVWCQQLRRSVLKALLEAVDFAAPGRVYSLAKRMSVFKKNLLSGFEETAREESVARRHLRKDALKLKIDIHDAIIQSGANEIWKSSDAQTLSVGRTFNVLPLTDALTVLVLTDQLMPRIELLSQMEKAPYSVLLCGKSGNADREFDFLSASTNEFLDLVCVDTSLDFNEIPRSAKSEHKLEDSAFDGEAQPFWAVHYKSEDIREFETLLIVHNHHEKVIGAESNQGFMVAQTSDCELLEHVVRGDMFSLITRDAEVSLLANRPLAVNLNISGAWSSILAYKVALKESSGDLFEPFIRQWIEDPYETKWIINLRGKSLFLTTIHGVAPFIPFKEHKTENGLNLQLWSDPQGGWSEKNVAAVELTVSVDWLNSLKLLVMRYRLSVVSHCLAVTGLVMVFQFRKYTLSGKFPDYTYGLSRITRVECFVPAMLALWLLTPTLKLKGVQYLLNIIDPVVLQDSNEIKLSLYNDFRLNSFYLGLEETCLSFIGPLFFIIAIGINFLTYHAFTTLGRFVVVSVQGCCRATAYVLRRSKADTTETNTAPKSFGKKVFASACLLLLVPIHLPYQFAYVISFAIHTTTCVRMLRTKGSSSCWNFNMSILMMMAWVLPINVPVMIVFVHNLNVSWAAPFTSHHNFLAVAPVLVLVELCSYFGAALPLGTESNDKLKSSWISKVSLGMLIYLVGYSIVYGTRHTYWLHHLFNFWCCCLCLMLLNTVSGHAPGEAH